MEKVNLTSTSTDILKHSSHFWTSVVVSLTVFFLVTLLNVFENFRVMSILFTMPKRKQKASQQLIAHLSLLNILMNVDGAFYTLRRFQQLEAHTSYLVCAVSSYLRNVLVSAISLNICFWNYATTFKFERNYQGGEVLVKRCLLIIWSAAAIGNLPSFFMARVNIPPGKELGECAEQPLFNSAFATIVYEACKRVCYNLLPVIHMMHSLCLVTSSVTKYLRRSNFSDNPAVNRKLRNIRLVFYNAVAFTVVWIPAMTLLGCYKVIRRISNKVESTSLISSEKSSPSIFFWITILILLTYLILCPLIYLHLSHHTANIGWFQFTYARKKRIATGNLKQVNIKENQNKNNPAVCSPSKSNRQNSYKTNRIGKQVRFKENVKVEANDKPVSWDQSNKISQQVLVHCERQSEIYDNPDSEISMDTFSKNSTYAKSGTIENDVV